MEGSSFSNSRVKTGEIHWQRYLFSEQILNEIKALCKLDNWHGFLQLLEDWFIIVCFIFVSELNFTYYNRLSTIISLIVYAMTIFIIGTRMRGLAEILHQSAHGTLCQNRKLNLILGTLPSGWVVLQSWSVYRKTHVFQHHPFLGDPNSDPDVQVLIEQGLYEENITQLEKIMYLLKIPSVSSTILYIKYLIKNRIYSNIENRFEFYTRISFLAGVLAALYYLDFLSIFVRYWLVPLLTTANWLGAFIELSEHYPLLMRKGKVTKDIYMSRNRLTTPLENFFIGIHQENFHLVHHLFPRIPAWNFFKAHAILMKDSAYFALHQKQKVGLAGLLYDMLNPTQ